MGIPCDSLHHCDIFELLNKVYQIYYNLYIIVYIIYNYRNINFSMQKNFTLDNNQIYCVTKAKFIINLPKENDMLTYYFGSTSGSI